VELSEDVDPLEAPAEQPREVSVNVVVMSMQSGYPANTQLFFDDHGNPYTHPVRGLYHLERRVSATERDADMLDKALRGDVEG
jgi:hypothetical protein